MATLWLVLGTIALLVLDVLAKIGFGLLLLTNHQALSDVMGGQAQPSRVR